MMNLGFGEIFLLLLLVLLFFGGRRLPALGQSLGQAWLNFRKELRKDDDKDQRKLS